MCTWPRCAVQWIKKQQTKSDSRFKYDCNYISKYVNTQKLINYYYGFIFLVLTVFVNNYIFVSTIHLCNNSYYLLCEAIKHSVGYYDVFTWGTPCCVIRTVNLKHICQQFLNILQRCMQVDLSRCCYRKHRKITLDILEEYSHQQLTWISGV